MECASYCSAITTIKTRKICSKPDQNRLRHRPFALSNRLTEANRFPILESRSRRDLPKVSRRKWAEFALSTNGDLDFELVCSCRLIPRGANLLLSCFVTCNLRARCGSGNGGLEGFSGLEERWRMGVSWW